ncbi:MAG: M1 family metallopeptidase [Chloroflexi bacterium]|nr:M1 family metallopeptidase [Chloroflexota bacterium]
MFINSKILNLLRMVMIFVTGYLFVPMPGAQAAVENWDDREVFRAGLIAAEQKTPDTLPGASVYHIDVRIADDYMALDGQERVRYTNQENVPLESLYFQLFPNMVGGKSRLTAFSIDGRAVEPVYEDADSAVRLPLSVALQPGEQVAVQMDFHVDVPSEAGDGYGLFSYLDGVLALDGFYPAIPVYDQQGWHKGPVPVNADTTFQDTSFYVVQVTAPAALVLVASGTQVEKTLADAHQVVTFAAGPVRDFYMVGSERFVVISAMAGETKVNSYAFKGFEEGSQLALRTAVDALNIYGRRLGAYPYSEFDVVSTPIQGAGGIEYPGITGIDYNYYNFNPDDQMYATPAPELLESTVAHEVGHQWFYNMVGNDQINQPWVDEALTEYLTGQYYLDEHGQSGWDGYRDSWVQAWGMVDEMPIPIGLPAASYQGSEYGGIVYGRGPLFIDALAQKLGQGSFDQFLRDYALSYKWGISSQAAFQQSAEKQCQCSLSGLFDAWVNEK